ncbi:hypothetical protein BU26DRAFT_513311 [Trematosphaeria pertusa]|uniref:Galactose oxidase n=1 Tax=Trematosphaeria pertusa TaxID=390896 RepID=A0A6A6J1R1_9PLEO|nr:uncharacterized protein BU26DRAFT_513311 [Trematosphaeria pertusa]KAF2256498.1 hypothetical protein BU26DRAFT_513311 [Trematosphaeria pertusa]
MPSPTTPSFALLREPLLCAFVLFSGATAQMPYNPTQIFRSGALVYVFRPSSGSTSQFELGAVDISSHVAASALPYTALYPALPFLDANNQRAFNPILDNGDNITVYTGDCSTGARGSELWTFIPEPADKSGNGTWRQEDISFDEDGRHASDIGANYLSGGMAFSAIVNGNSMDTEVYFFGGMCPFQGESSASWQSAANYSNLMIALEPSKSTTRSLDYHLGVSSSRGPPIAEAGFTLTGLLPSFSNQSDGTQTQQQNFVLVGGHTSSAFINTSQVALFSLPQQSWTFIPVSQPDTSRTDLAIRTDVTAIEPRSGHSAVLTPDGRRIIVFGGWIGDIDTPADPQLAVLNVGDGYGGQGDWEWTVPSTSSSGLSDGSGLYGHGAAMLPGDIMMIMGGYSMSAPSSRRRRASPASNTQTLFFNISSNAWITGYSPPPEATPAEPVKTGPLSTPSQKAGLGAGLGIGVAAVIGLLAFYLWYTRRLKRQRDLREKQLQELAMGAHRYNLECISPGIDGRGGHPNYLDESSDSYFYPSVGRAESQGWRRANAHDAERTGLLVEIPSPTRGLRRSLGGRANTPMSRYDERRVRGSGHIHPIDELEEEQEHDGANDTTPLNGRPEMTERMTNKGASIFDNAPILDPFTDNSRPSGEQKSVFHSAPTSPIREDGPADWQPSVALHLPRHSSPNPAGRVSPTKSSERTGSNLSERSTRSTLSSRSTDGSLGRSASMRSAPILNNASQANPFRTPDASPTTDTANQGGSGWQTPIDPRTRSFTSIRSNGRPTTAGADADSFTTARSSFMALQAEGEALLGGNPERGRPGTSSTSNGSNGPSYRDAEGTISGAGTITAATSFTDGFSRAANGRERRKSWLGSVRRALSRSTSNAARTRSLTTPTTQLECYSDNPSPVREPGSTSNRKSFPASNPPRRAASDASFWSSKRGKQDWLDDELDPNDPRARWRRNSGDNWGAPEDLALAEEERQRREWRERSSLLVNLADEEQLPTPRTPIRPGELGVPASSERPRTPADEEDWDVEAAVERRVVQVMFTVPKSKLRVVNADIDRSSILSLPRENSKDSDEMKAESSGSPASSTPNRVKNLAGRYEQMSSPKMTPRASPRPSPSPSIKSLKVRAKGSSTSLTTPTKSSSPSATKGKEKAVDE